MFFLPNLWLRGQIQERQRLIEDALPDAMDLLVTCVEAGLALDAAMSRVAQELELVAPVLAQELKQTLLEIQAGVRRSDAFHRLSNRTGVEDLRTLSAMIIQTEMFGTSVSRALRVHAEGMRTKRMQRAEEKAAMVSVKMTVPLILCILPSLMAVVIGPAVGDDRGKDGAMSWFDRRARLDRLRRGRGRVAAGVGLRGHDAARSAPPRRPCGAQEAGARAGVARRLAAGVRDAGRAAPRSSRTTRRC